MAIMLRHTSRGLKVKASGSPWRYIGTWNSCTVSVNYSRKMAPDSSVRAHNSLMWKTNGFIFLARHASVLTVVTQHKTICTLSGSEDVVWPERPRISVIRPKNKGKVQQGKRLKQEVKEKLTQESVYQGCPFGRGSSYWRESVVVCNLND